MAAILEKEKTDEAKASTMRGRGSGDVAEKAGSSDCVKGEMTRAKPVKIARDGFVTRGPQTAITMIFFEGRDPNEEVSGCEQPAGTKVMGEAVDIEGDGAAEEEETGGVTCTDDERARNASRRTRMWKSVGLVGIGRAV